MDRRQTVGSWRKKWRNNGRNLITNGRKKLGVFGELNLQQTRWKKGRQRTRVKKNPSSSPSNAQLRTPHSAGNIIDLFNNTPNGNQDISFPRYLSRTNKESSGSESRLRALYIYIIYPNRKKCEKRAECWYGLFRNRRYCPGCLASIPRPVYLAFNSTKVWVPFQSFRSRLQRMLAFCVYNLLRQWKLFLLCCGCHHSLLEICMGY